LITFNVIILLQQLFKNFASFLLYSNLFIAISAVAMSLETLALMGEAGRLWILQGEVFAATLCIYAMHRLVSLQRLREELVNERFRTIRTLRRLIWVVLAFSITLGAILFWWLKFNTQLALVLPAILSLGYVLPFWQNKRLRDFHFLKIFLIAGVWAYVTVFLPSLEADQPIDLVLFLRFSERALFIFAITLPFDIRDWEIEKANGVQTIPSLIGVPATVYLGLSCLLLWVAACWGLYAPIAAGLLTVVALLTAGLVWGSRRPQPDYYFTGLLDGTMLLQGVVVVLVL
jgi:4-hydroxybenzoate polyprenyltransferase